MRIQNTLRATQLESYWLSQGKTNLIGGFPVWRIFLLLYRHHEGAKGCSMRIQNVSEIAQFAFKKNMAGAALFDYIGA
jgi:hypothetical protein